MFHASDMIKDVSLRLPYLILLGLLGWLTLLGRASRTHIGRRVLRPGHRVPCQNSTPPPDPEQAASVLKVAAKDPGPTTGEALFTSIVAETERG